MKKGALWTSLLVVLLVAGVIAIWPAADETAIVRVTAAPGTIVQVSYELDGEQYEIEDTVPVEFEVVGRELLCTVAKSDQPSPLAISLVLGNKGEARTVGEPHQELQCGFRVGSYKRSAVSLWANAVPSAPIEGA